MRAFFILSILPLALGACDIPGAEDNIETREAPDVPWPSVEIAGQIKSPVYVGQMLADCFAAEAGIGGTGITYGAPTLVHYADKTPDGDDQQPAELCLSWSAHLDFGDCVRRGLIELGATVQP